MSVKYRKWRLRGSCNSKTLQPISIKIGISDHIAHPTPKFGYNQFKRGVVANARNSPLGVYFFTSFVSDTRLQVRTLDRLTLLMTQTKRSDAGYTPYKFTIINFSKIYTFYTQF